MMESTRVCDELDDYFATFDDIIKSMKKIHQFMEPILLPVTGLLVIDCLIAVRVYNQFSFKYLINICSLIERTKQQQL